MSNAIDKINAANINPDISDFTIGDTVTVHTKVREGDKERIQLFAGIVIARDGAGATETFTVRRVSYGVGVEKVFPVHTPHITAVDIVRSGHVRRAKLYYLRELAGKKARLREKIRR